jgi:hypothetical protein
MQPFVLYIRERCSLCELAIDIVRDAGLLKRTAIIAIDDDDELLGRYMLRIPVFARTDQLAEVDWPFDAEAIIGFSSATR